MVIVLDSGALIAIDRRDRQIGALLRVANREGIAVRTSSGAVAQVWRNGARQANLARMLAGIDDVALDAGSDRRVGELIGRVGTTDAVDGHIALIANPGDTVLTSDDADIMRLLDARGTGAHVRHV